MTDPLFYHPGPSDPTPQERLLLMNDDTWESFIEDCVRQLMVEGMYVRVQRLGGPGDKGRDVCGYSDSTADQGTWDLYQAKYYEGPLTPSEFVSDLAKFITHIYQKSYTCPRSYFICASRGIGVTLFDYINDVAKLRSWLLKTWKDNNGKFGSFKQQLTPELEAFVQSFPLEIVKNKTPADLLDIHSRNAVKHWEKFGVVAQREPNPEVPGAPEVEEQRYIEALLRVYAEHDGRHVTDSDSIPAGHRKHFKAQRRLFYCAEGLSRFSRDKLPGAFEELLEQVEVGIGSVVASPHQDGMSRLTATLQVANTLRIETNPLRRRLQAGDLPGSCHHLANQGRIEWVHDDEDDNTNI